MTMHARRTTVMGGAVVMILTAAASIVAFGQQKKPMDMPGMNMPMTAAQKIANAMTAAPPAIASKATILDWPAKEGEKPPVLRPGTNGWSCLPDMPESKGNDPMCLDGPWMKWVEAYMTKTKPAVGHVGVGYMTAAGGGWGSNSDPYAMTEAPDNHWGFHKPHVMIVVPDVAALAGMSTDPENGGPYVMYAGTPYAHIMAPVPSAEMPMPARR